MAVIKANAYGHGLVPAAKALAQTDGFAVARLEEGARAARRRASPTASCCSRACSARSSSRGRAAALRPDGAQRRAARAARGPRRHPQSISAWIKVDTGMNRLGFRVEQFADAYARLRRVAERRPGSDAGHAPRERRRSARRQDRRSSCRRSPPRRPGWPGARSIANSAALLAWPDTRADWVRPGLMLYGVSPFPGGTGAELGLRPAMTLQTRGHRRQGRPRRRDRRLRRRLARGARLRASRWWRRATATAIRAASSRARRCWSTAGARRSSGACRWT